jgi:hypothetical protein
MKERKAVLFVNKKNQKNFITLGHGWWHRHCLNPVMAGRVPAIHAFAPSIGEAPDAVFARH